MEAQIKELVVKLLPLSTPMLERWYSKAYRQLERQHPGGTMFGRDWPTMRLVHPGFYIILRAILIALAEHEKASHA
jgi:hypothetical protein